MAISQRISAKKLVMPCRRNMLITARAKKMGI